MAADLEETGLKIIRKRTGEKRKLVVQRVTPRSSKTASLPSLPSHGRDENKSARGDASSDTSEKRPSPIASPTLPDYETGKNDASDGNDGSSLPSGVGGRWLCTCGCGPWSDGNLAKEHITLTKGDGQSHKLALEGGA